MDWIYLSPHLDDVALSCGGLVWEQAHSGDFISIWTICAGDPPKGTISPFAQKLHNRWETDAYTVAERRLEDKISCELLSASHRHFGVPDCIYRRLDQGNSASNVLSQSVSSDINNFLYNSEVDLFGDLHPSEESLINSLSQVLLDAFPKRANIVAPLGIGRHVDHQLTRSAAESTGRKLWFYQDYPYILGNVEKYKEMELAGWKSTLFHISTGGFQSWTKSILAHQSQISSFWVDLEDVKESISYYLDLFGGFCLWQEP